MALFQIVNGHKWFYFEAENSYCTWLRPDGSPRFVKEDWQGAGWYRRDTFDRDSDYEQTVFATSRSLIDTITVKKVNLQREEAVLRDLVQLANEKPEKQS